LASVNSGYKILNTQCPARPLVMPTVVAFRYIISDISERLLYSYFEINYYFLFTKAVGSFALKFNGHT